MRKHNLNYVVVGLFVTAMVLAAVVSVTLLAGRGGVRDGYFTVLDNVADVGFGTQVRFEGYPVGQVERITPLAAGAGMRFRVELSIDRGWRLPADSVARIGNTSVLSAKTVDIESGRSETAIARGGEIPGRAAADVFSAMAGVAAQLGDLGRLVGTLTKLAETLEQRAPGLVDRTAGLIAHLDASAEALSQILSSGNVRSVQGMVGNAEQASRTLMTTSRELAATMAKVDRLIAGLDGLVARNSSGLDRSLRDMEHTLGSVAQNIDSMIHNLDTSSRNISEFSRLIRQNPGLLLGGTPREEVSSRGGSAAGAAE